MDINFYKQNLNDNSSSEEQDLENDCNLEPDQNAYIEQE